MEGEWERGKDRARTRDLTDKNKMRYFCKAFDVHRNPRNVSKVSADISDNALSLLKTKIIGGKNAVRQECRRRAGKRETSDIGNAHTYTHTHTDT